MDDAGNPFALDRTDVTAPPADPPIGRARELAAIDAMLDALAAGAAASPILVAGRSGTGTSSVAAAVAARASVHDWWCGAATVSCDEPLRDALATALARALHELAARRPGAAGLRVAADAVAGFAPVVADALPVPVGHEALAVARGDLARDVRRLVAQVGDALRELVGRGIVVVLDDLHAALAPDAAAVVSAFVDAMQAGSPVALVAAGTPTVHHVAALAGAAGAVLELGPLGPADVEALLARAVAPDAPGGFTAAGAAAIARATAGYPALVLRYARAACAAAAGGVVDEAAVAAGAGAARDGLAQDVLAPTFALEAPARRYVRAVAEADDPADSLAVARRLGDTTRFGSGASQLTILRDDLVRRGVLATVDGVHLTFAHPAARSYVLSWG